MCDVYTDTKHCANCNADLTSENRLYVLGAHVYTCSAPCYHEVTNKMRALFTERGKSIEPIIDDDQYDWE